MFFVRFFVFFVTLWNEEICDNGNAMKQCNFQNNYGVNAYREVCSCAPIFKFFCERAEFSLKGKFIPKTRNQYALPQLGKAILAAP